MPDGRGKDPDDREAWVACGAALLNLRLAIRGCGVDPVVHLLPERHRPLLLATIKIDGRRPSTPDGLELTMAIGLLHRHTKSSEPAALPGPLIAKLRSAGRIEGAWIALLPATTLAALGEFLNRSCQEQLLDPAAHVVLVGTLQDDPASRLRAGQAMQRMLLLTARSNLGTCFLPMSPDVAATRNRLRQLLGGGLWPQALVQIGRRATAAGSVAVA